MDTVIDSELLRAQLRASAASSFLLTSDLTQDQADALVAMLEALTLMSRRLCDIDTATRYEGRRH